MSEPLRLTIVYEDAGDGDGWVVARIPQVRGEISQGRTRQEARENVIDALRELLAVRFGLPPELPDPADSDSLELTIAACSAASSSVICSRRRASARGSPAQCVGDRWTRERADRRRPPPRRDQDRHGSRDLQDLDIPAPAGR